jgi:Zn-dependent peptidase ImmA (M78 family)
MAIVAPFLPYEKLRGIAADFLRQHHPSGELPIPIEKIVEFKFRLDIVPVPGLQDKFDVDAYVTSDLKEIRVDGFIQENRSTRYRFSLAHELSHLLIHQDVFKELHFSTIQEWKSAIISIPEEQYSWIEWQGYALAGLILVPPEPLASVFGDKIKEARKAGIELLDVDEEMRRVVESHIGRYFEVSADVVARRMKCDKLWG